MNPQLEAYMPVFKQNYLVHGLPDEAVEEIASLAEYCVFVAGEKLLTIGDKASDLYVVLDGKVHIYGKEGDSLSTAAPPSILGEVALVDDLERSADAVCAGLVKCAQLPGKKLRKYMWDHKEHGFVMLANLSRVLSMRLRKANITMVDLMGKAQDHWKHVS